MIRPAVSIVRHADTYRSLREAVDICGGLAGLGREEKILIKPNIVDWEFDLPFPPFGVVTTSEVVFALVRILAEEGFNKLTIGEGGLPAPRTKGRKIYKALGYEKLKDRYGVDLVDFNEEKFHPVDYGEFKLSVAERVLGADKLINLPVLKTHTMCKVSLGLKNLKGCLDRKSKIFCHHEKYDLEQLFPRIIEKLPVALTIIDGIYALERGPSPAGRAYRKDLLLASRDAYACDLAGAEVMGYPAGEVPHLRYYAQRHDRSTDLTDIEIKGEDIAGHRARLDYDWEWSQDDSGPAGFKKMGISGLTLRRYDHSMCTGCAAQFHPMLVMLMSAYTGEPFPGVEILVGKRRLAARGFEKTVLFGKCACRVNKDNPNINQAVPVNGCPVDLKKFEKIMRSQGIKASYQSYVDHCRHTYDRYYRDKEGFDLGLYLK